ncbi:RNA-binding domain-containing protein [Wilcoxina mikolae CBS 423.85]|nr:RNA-binding domain-containing protein [Wilcoxina mikolae CBS 423.85]
MDRALDDVVRERQQNNRNRNQRRSTPRGGVRKPGRNTNGAYDESRLWVHDKFDGDSNDGPRRTAVRDNPIAGRLQTTGAKVKVENIHYELGKEDLFNLFRRKGPVVKLDLLYDRAGRSEGTAFVTYAREEDALSAIKDYGGANAHGQPITLTLVSRNTTGAPIHPIQSRPRSLFDRIASPDVDGPVRERRRSADDRRDPTRKPTPPGIDRYVPPERRRERDRERTQPGPRPAAGRENGGRGRRGGAGGRGDGAGRAAGGGSVRPKKTVEELDAEMNDYFGNAEQTEQVDNAPQTATTAAAPAADEDEDMIL